MTSQKSINSVEKSQNLRQKGMRPRSSFREFGAQCFLSLKLFSIRDFLLQSVGLHRSIVVYYHRIGGKDVLSRPKEEFDRDVEFLKNNYECVTLHQFFERLVHKKKSSTPLAVITFDDGYKDNYLDGVSILKKHGVPATFFVSTGFIGTEREFPHDLDDEEDIAQTMIAQPEGSRYPKMTWEDLRIMEEQGFEIGSHTVNHLNMGKVSVKTMDFELRESYIRLQKELGEKPRAFSFPWGKPKDFTYDAMYRAWEIGYYTVAAAYGGAMYPWSSPLFIRRFDTGNGNFSRTLFEARVRGLDYSYLRYRLRGFIGLDTKEPKVR